MQPLGLSDEDHEFALHVINDAFFYAPAISGAEEAFLMKQQLHKLRLERKIKALDRVMSLSKKEGDVYNEDFDTTFFEKTRLLMEDCIGEKLRVETLISALKEGQDKGPNYKPFLNALRFAVATIWHLGVREINSSNEFKELFRAIAKPPLTNPEVMRVTNCGWSEGAAISFVNTCKRGEFEFDPLSRIESETTI